jgi:hypothetical protein
MLYSEIINVGFEVHAKYIKALLGKNIEFLVLYLAVYKATTKV